ncbi:MAG: DUF4838 domain-containing protein [Sedimentisphaeraceae bacterium JB056]
MFRVILAVTFLCCLNCFSEPLEIVADGASEYKIVIGSGAVESVKTAAEDLQHYIQKATGVRLPVEKVDDFTGFNGQRKAIVIGVNDYTKPFSCKLSSLKRESCVVINDGSNLIIAGDDTAGNPLSSKLTTMAGSWIGVSEFCEKHLGIRWFLPGEKWEYVPHVESLVLDDIDEVYEPDFVSRRIAPNYVGHDPLNPKRAGLRKEELMKWLRRNGGGAGMIGRPTHSVDKIMAPFVKNNKYIGRPEWLALYDGKRMIPKTESDFKHWYRFHLCTSNQRVRDITVDYVLNFFKENPEYDVCGISMTDGDRYCQCEKCKAQDAEGTDSKTDRFMDFFVYVANEVAKVYPDKKVGTYIYSYYVDPPVKEIDIPDNLYMVHVQNGTSLQSREEADKIIDRINSWGNLSDNMDFYSWPVSHGFFSLPLSNTKWITEHLKTLYENGYNGYNCLFYGSVHVRQPDIYLWIQLLWDIDKSPESVLNEFYNKLYGGAADDIRSYFELIENNILKVNEENNLQKDKGDDAVLKYEDLITASYADVLADAGEILLRAKDKVCSDERIAYRVDVLLKNYHYLKMITEAIDIGRKKDNNLATADQIKRLEHLRIKFAQFLIDNGNTDVVDIVDISYIPSYGREDIARYLLIPKDIDRYYSVEIDKRPESRWKGLDFVYVSPTEALQADLLVSLPLRWNFKLDNSKIGEQQQWLNKPIDESYQEIRIDRPWNKQGVDKRGIGWYKTQLSVPSFESGSKIWLLFNAVDGKAKVWINGDYAGSQDAPVYKMWNKPWALDVTDMLKPGSTNSIAVKVLKYDPNGAVGIWKPIELKIER